MLWFPGWIVHLTFKRNNLNAWFLSFLQINSIHQISRTQLDAFFYSLKLDGKSKWYNERAKESKNIVLNSTQSTEIYENALLKWHLLSCGSNHKSDYTIRRTVVCTYFSALLTSFASFVQRYFCLYLHSSRLWHHHIFDICTHSNFTS